MASLKRWGLVGLAVCLALALAYLPPRGAIPSDRSIFVAQSPRATRARQRAQAVADEWRVVDGSLQLLRARRQMHELLREATAGTSLVVMSESADVATAAPPIADSALHFAWRELGLGETKVRVAVILQLATGSQLRDRPLPEEGRAAYLAPDSTDRTICIAVVSAGPYWTRVLRGESRGRVPFEALVQSLKAGLGPCAFYAAYGTPGASVRDWLVRRGWDLALTLNAGTPERGYFAFQIADPSRPWFWEVLYTLPPNAVACVARRPDGCRAAVLDGARDNPVVPVPDIVRIDRRWGRRVPRLAGGQRFLGDVARAVGRDRFLSFWTSDAPVDTALAVALKRPVGEWTADWQSGFAPPIRLGPGAPLGSVALALLLAALAVALVAITASRRQVR